MYKTWGLVIQHYPLNTKFSASQDTKPHYELLVVRWSEETCWLSSGSHAVGKNVLCPCTAPCQNVKDY